MADIPKFPDDIIHEILSRLPVKTLIQLQCVCKSWRNIISGDPVFAKTQLAWNTMDPNTCGLIQEWGSVAIFTHLGNFKSLPLRSKCWKIGGSVNGLVCVYRHYHATSSIKHLGIWNPTTNQYKDIPCPAAATKDMRIDDFNLGIGYDPITNDYKVVFVTVVKDHELVAEVYSCNTCSWRNTSVKSTFVARGRHCPKPTIVRGCPYWYNHGVNSPDHCYVMSFDMTYEVFKLLPGITFGKELGMNNRRVMVNLRDSLAVCIYSRKESPLLHVHVYVFDERCGVWSKNYTVGPITIKKPRRLILFHFLKNGDMFYEDDGYLKLLHINPEIHVIDKAASGSYLIDDYVSSFLLAYSFDYIDSLVSVKGMHHIRRLLKLC